LTPKKVSGLGKFAVVATLVGVALLIIAAIVNFQLDQDIQRKKTILISGSPEEKASILTKEQLGDVLKKSGVEELGINVDTLTEDQMRNIIISAEKLNEAQENLRKLTK